MYRFVNLCLYPPLSNYQSKKKSDNNFWLQCTHGKHGHPFFHTPVLVNVSEVITPECYYNATFAYLPEKSFVKRWGPSCSDWQQGPQPSLCLNPSPWTAQPASLLPLGSSVIWASGLLWISLCVCYSVCACLSVFPSGCFSVSQSLCLSRSLPFSSCPNYDYAACSMLPLVVQMSTFTVRAVSCSGWF